MHGAAPLLVLLAFSAVSALPQPLPARASAVDHQKPRYSVVPLEPSSDQPGGGNDGDDGSGSGNGNGNGGAGSSNGIITVTRTVVETEVPVTVTRTAAGATTVTRELATTISIVDIEGPATATVTATVTAKPLSSSSSSSSSSQPLVPPAVSTRPSMTASGAHSSATLIMTTATPSEISTACATPAVTAAAAISPMGQIGPGTGSLASSSVLVTAVSPHLSSGHTIHASALSSTVGSWNGTAVSYRFRRQ